MPTLTVYPDPGDPGTTTMDGVIFAANATYATVHDAASGDSINSTVTDDLCARNGIAAGSYRIRRSFFTLDTSSLGSTVTISAATFSLAGNGTATGDADTDSANLYSNTQTSNTTLALGDYSKVGTTAYATAITFANWITTAGTYNDFTLNSTGINNISLTGITKISLRDTKDVSNTQPAGDNQIYCRYADQAGTSSDPKLVVTYTLAGGAAPTLLTLGVG